MHQLIALGHQVIAFLLCSSIVCSTPLHAQSAFPADARQHLDSAYPGWRFAALSRQLARDLPRDVSPRWIRGDFDGDSTGDYAVQIVLPRSSADSAQRLLFLLRRPSGYADVPIMAGPRSESIYLSGHPGGTKAMDLEARDDSRDADPESGMFTLLHDAVDVLYGEVAGSTCFLEAGRPRCVVSGD